MWQDFEEMLVPLFEFLGIPMIILTPLAIILFILFKYVLPKMLTTNRNATGFVVANIVAQLFGEGTGVVKGVEELDVAKLIKTLPTDIQNVLVNVAEKLSSHTQHTDEKLNLVLTAFDDKMNSLFDKTTLKLNEVGELLGLLSQAMMSERLLKPQSSRLLQEISTRSKGMVSNTSDIKIDLTPVLEFGKEVVDTVEDAVEMTEEVVDKVETIVQSVADFVDTLKTEE